MKKKKYHLIGIGGIGVGGLALLLIEKGFEVTGSDVQENAMVTKLKNRGAQIFIGHAKENINQVDCVVYSSAVKNNNPEILEAQRKNIPVIKRAELLAELMKEHIGITVAGAHGKTTTSSLVSHMMEFAGLNPTSAIGGIVHGLQSNASLGEGKYFVAEADESDGTFLNYFPDYSIITNIDLEHVDYYQNWDNVLLAYKKFIGNTKPEGLIFACGDDQQLLKLLKEAGSHYKTFGFDAENNITLKNLKQEGFRSEFECMIDGEDLGLVELNIPGRHNVLNALAAIGLGVDLKIDFNQIAQSLKEFQGVQRRFDVKGEASGVTVIDDYAHHPSEISAILETAKFVEANRLIVVFQPHRFSRLQYLMDEFVNCLKNLENLIVTDVYAASEQQIEGVNSSVLAERIKKVSSGNVEYIQQDDLNAYLLEFLKSGDVLLTLGAGNITYMADELLDMLKERNSQDLKISA